MPCMRAASSLYRRRAASWWQVISLVRPISPVLLHDFRDVNVVPIQAGDRFLLASDGLTGVVPDEQLLSFAKEKPEVQQCADDLCQLALDQGSRDNISCIVVDVVEVK